MQAWIAQRIGWQHPVQQFLGVIEGFAIVYEDFNDEFLGHRVGAQDIRLARVREHLRQKLRVAFTKLDFTPLG